MAKKKAIKTLDDILADTVQETTNLTKRVCEEIEGEIYRLSARLEIASRAEDRGKIERAINARIKKLQEAIAETETSALVKAKEGANKASGLEVKHSSAYTREIIRRVHDQSGQNLAAVFSNKMSSSIIDALRAATVSTIQEAALTGLSLREQKNLLREKWEKACKGLGEAKFVDKSGRDWNARDYFTMNIRTNAMRVYNDVLAGNIVTEGGDLAQISQHGSVHCSSCFPWEGRIISITGKTKGFPTYEKVRSMGCFHPNCTHTLDTVSDVVDEEEIEFQKSFNAGWGYAGADPMAYAYRMDVARKMKIGGMSKEEAEISTKRERLEKAMSEGLGRDGHLIVSHLADELVEELTNGIAVPRFSSARKYEQPEWRQGTRGGRIILDNRHGREAVESLLHVMSVAEEKAKRKKQGNRGEVETAIPTSPDAYEVGKSLGGASGAHAHLATDKRGSQYVMKTAGSGISNEALQNEAQIDAFYRAMGIDVPEGVTFAGEDGETVKVSKFIDGGTNLKEWWKKAKLAEQQAMADKLVKGFATDCLLGNWDFIGMEGDNILVDKNGTPWRIDNGGSGAFRAMGSRKKAQDWEDGLSKGAPSELWTMTVSPNNADYMLRASVMPDAKTICHEIATAKWDKALEKLDAETRKVVEARIAQCKKLDDLQVLESAANVTKDNVKSFLEGCENYGAGAYTVKRLAGALNLGDYTNHPDPVGEAEKLFISQKDAQTIAQAKKTGQSARVVLQQQNKDAHTYTTSKGCDEMNQYLRENKVASGTTEERIKKKCDRFARSIERDKEKSDIWLYRGACYSSQTKQIFGAEFDNLRDLKGFEWSDNGFLSCSPIKGGGYSSRDVQCIIYCPKGAEMKWLEHLTQYPGENEMALQRGSKFVITNVEYTYKKDKCTLTMMLIGQGK